MPKLNWKLLTKKRAGVTQGLPPGKEDLAWVMNTVTLIYGERDLGPTLEGAGQLTHTKSGKNLTAIYITHAHGDHFFGLKIVRDKFPNARAFATASTVRPAKIR
jgi:glyoxylase-like metal-dependent hydrolase (beta-lactamase superfamily II)